MAGKVTGRIMAEIGGGLGKAEHAKLGFYAAHANQMQRMILKNLMRTNKNTDYGKRNRFRDVRSIEDYQRIVPFSAYEDYADYIRRMANGEKNLITSKYIGRYAESSGSTGKSKLVPISAWSLWVCQCFSFSAPVGCAVKHFKRLGKRLPPQRGLLTVEAVSHKLPCGRTASGLAPIPLLYLKPIVRFFATSPYEILFPKSREPMDMHYMKLRFSLIDNKVSYLGTVFITMLESMFFYLENNWQMLCDDIEKGIISQRVVVPPDIRKRLEKKLRPLPERAAQLRAEFQKGFDTPIIPRIWPNVGWLYGMGTGSLALYAKKLRRYIGEDLPIHYLGYAASEGLMAVPLELDSFEYALLPQNGFYEFLPPDSPEGTKPLTIGELTPGTDYEIILTNLSGLYRYRIGDVVRVTGYYKETPKITFMYRLNQIANITGEKISQQAFDLLIDDLSRITGTSFTGYCLYADRDTSPGHYVVLLEPVEPLPAKESETYARIFEERLCETNALVYPQIRNGALGHCEVRFLRAGANEEYREFLRQNGANLNQVKPVRVIDTPEKKQFFFDRIAGE